MTERDDGGERQPRTEIVWCVRQPRTGRFALACIAKRTYALGPKKLALADEQVPLVDEPVLESVPGDDYRSLLDDTDLVGEKVATDVVVLGSAHSATKTRELYVAVAVSGFARRLRVSGERRAEVLADGTVRFSTAEPFEHVRLGDAVAYGGYDAHAHDVLDPPPPRAAPPVPPVDLGPGLELDVPPPRDTGLFAYARNAAGRAFFFDVDRARADGAPLPLVEDPSDALTPERFFVPEPLAWIDQPIPGTLGWVHHASYPRIARLVGPLLPHRTPARPIRETQLGDGDGLADQAPLEPGTIDPRAAQGAAPGLARERLRGDEPVVLQNLHPTIAELAFELPGEAPRFSVRPPDIKVFTPKPVLQTVRIEPDLGRVSLVWAGFVPLLAPVDEEFLERCELAIRWTRI